MIASLVWFLQSMGYWSVTMYLPEYMGSLGIDPYMNMFTVFIGEIPGLVLDMILIEPHMLGRFKCLRFFSVFTAAGLILFAFVPVDFLKAVCVIVVYFFMVPIYSILNTFTPEVYPTGNRSMAMAWMYMVIAFPGLITAFLSASVLSTNISWLYPTVAAAFFLLQFLFTFGLGAEPAGHGLNDTKDYRNRNQSSEVTTPTQVSLNENVTIGTQLIVDNSEATDAYISETDELEVEQPVSNGNGYSLKFTEEEEDAVAV